MHEEIPFFKNEKIKKVNIIDDYIIVTKYLNKLYTYNIYLKNNSNNYKLIEAEFYMTLEEYLLNNKDKYYQSKNINKRIGLKYLLLVFACSLGIYIPFLGLYLLNLSLIYLGILTMTLGILSVFYIGNSLVNKTMINNKEFCEEYEKLQKTLRDYFKDDIKNVKKIKINPIQIDRTNEKIKKKVRKK